MENNLKNRGTLYLIPAPLGDEESIASIPDQTHKRVASLRFFITEELRTARRYLKKLNPEIRIDDLTFFVFNEHSDRREVPSFIQPLLNGYDLGLMSEAGLPCIADPGAEIVRLAHSMGIRVVPLSGPSSILLGLIASGFNGQQFTFHGYLPVDQPERIRKIKELERVVAATDYTQIFMETPYRNTKLVETLVNTLSPETMLCIAAGITTGDEWIRTLPVSQWKKKGIQIGKVPAVFLLGR